jgi:hypothetical protein
MHSKLYFDPLGNTNISTKAMSDRILKIWLSSTVLVNLIFLIGVNKDRFSSTGTTPHAALKFNNVTQIHHIPSLSTPQIQTNLSIPVHHHQVNTSLLSK